MFKEFKEFAIKGNVVDMAVGIVIGAAFTAVVKSLVDDVVMPPLGLLTNGLDFTNLYWIIEQGKTPGPFETLEQAKASGATVIAHGKFLNSIVTFGLVSSVLFWAVRWINRLRRPDTPPAPNTKACPECKSPINAQAIRCPFCTTKLEPPTDSSFPL